VTSVPETMTDRDHYADGWAEGLREARHQVLRSADIIDAVNRIDGLLTLDSISKKERAAANRKRRGRR